MTRLTVVGGVILISVASWCAAASASDSCVEEDALVPNTTLTLTSAVKNHDGAFVGDFRLQNLRIARGIVIPARKASESFYIDYPDATVQFRDLNGTWTTLANHLPGTFGPSPDALKVGLHSMASFKVELFSVQLGNLSGTDFRLAIRLADRSCIVSQPFRAYPDRASITKIESLTTDGSASRN